MPTPGQSGCALGTLPAQSPPRSSVDRSPELAFACFRGSDLIREFFLDGLEFRLQRAVLCGKERGLLALGAVCKKRTNTRKREHERDSERTRFDGVGQVFRNLGQIPHLLSGFILEGCIN